MATRKKIYVAMLNQSISGVLHEARVYLDTDFDEYCVEFYHSDIHQPHQDYFTDDHKDAVGTARKALFDIGKQQAAVCTVYGQLPE
ncbi:hypothetical protein Kompost2_00005 [Pseudomonas phage vB_PpuP-Kompost-2]